MKFVPFATYYFLMTAPVLSLPTPFGRINSAPPRIEEPTTSRETPPAPAHDPPPAPAPPPPPAPPSRDPYPAPQNPYYPPPGYPPPPAGYPPPAAPSSTSKISWGTLAIGGAAGVVAAPLVMGLADDLMKGPSPPAAPAAVPAAVPAAAPLAVPAAPAPAAY